MQPEGIIRAVDQVADLYYQLVIVAAPAGVGKTWALREVARREAYPYVNVGLELSRRLLGLDERQRAVQAPELLGEIVGENEAKVVLLDNTELLFEASLKLEPLRCLQHLSRQRTIVAAWNGAIDNGQLIYAVPGHPEYRRYPAGNLGVVSLGVEI